MSHDTVLPAERTAHGSVSATRVGTRTYRGTNERGATVLIGPEEVPDAFSPGELFKLALAGCAGLSADRVIARRLGDDFDATFWAHGTSDEATNRYTAVDEEIVVAGLAGLDDAERAKLLDLVERSIERACTIARTVRDVVDLSTTVADVNGN
ncbi:OsmC family protein [Glaciibacter flavus]|uniref:OsmC family protein n=1 Tax=Orlajensenia flava TaxID=2565934 RepID=UPI003B005519